MHIGPVAVDAKLYAGVGDKLTAPGWFHIEHRGGEAVVVRENRGVDEVFKGLLASLSSLYALKMFLVEFSHPRRLQGRVALGWGVACHYHRNDECQ